MKFTTIEEDNKLLISFRNYIYEIIGNIYENQDLFK